MPIETLAWNWWGVAAGVVALVWILFERRR